MQESKENEPATSNAQEQQSKKTNKRTGRSWRALFNFTTRSDIPLLLCAISCSMAASIGGPAQAFIIGKVFDLLISVAAGSVSGEDFLQQESKWILYLVAIGGGSWLLHALEYTCWITFGERQARNARIQLYHTLSQKDISWFDSSDDSDGSALARYIAQIQELQLAVSQPFGGFLSLITTAVLAVAQAFYNSWDLTLVTLAGSPIVALVIIIFGSGMQKGIDNQNTALKEANSRSLAALSAIETVKYFVAEHFELEQYQVHVLEASKHYRGIVIRNALQMGSLTFLIQAMFVQAFYYGGVLIHRGSRNASQVVTTFFSAIAAFQAVQGILPQMLVLEKGRAAGHVLFELVQHGEQIDANTKIGRLRPLDCAGSIKFSRVSFRYPGAGNHLVLKQIDLLIRAREMTFIIGQSGSGKSTIGQLLVHFYTSYSGIITLDGNDLNALDRHWLRSNVFLVEQNSTLFNQTIGENIALGRNDVEQVSKAAINAAAEFALLQAMLADVPKGLDTIVDSEGGTISGGQRQRIALARARFRNAPVLILDESTSALDQINRSLMMAAIRTWRRGKTTIVITHDLTQIEQTDHVYVLDQGQVVQDGYRQQMQQALNKMKSLPRLPQHRTQLRSSMTASSSSDESQPSTTLAAASAFMQNVPAMSMLPTWADKRASIKPVARTAILTKQSSSSTAASWRPYHLPFFGQSRSEWLTRQPSEQTKIMSEYISKTGNTAVQSRRHGTRTKRLQHDEAMSSDMEDGGAPHAITHSMSETLKVLWHDCSAKMRLLLILGFWSATIHAVCPPVFAFVLSKLLKLYAIPTDTSHQALTYSLAIVAIAVADALHTYGYRYFLEMASQLWADKLRTRAMQSLLRQPISYFESEETSVTTITHTLDHDAEEMRNLVGRFIGMIYIAIATIVTSFIWALATQWKMTLFAITAAPYILVVTSIYSAVTERWEGTSHDAVKTSDLIFLETFKNIRTVRVLTAERKFEKQFNKAIENTLNVGKRRAIITGLLYGMSTSATTFATAMVFYIGSRLIHDGADVSAVLQVFTVLIFTISNVSAILDYVPQLGTAKDTAWRLLALTSLPLESHEHSGTTQISSVGDVTLTRLRFAYPSRPDTVVLSDIDFIVQRNLVTAIVGGSGSGKSTIAKLILKLHEAGSQSLARQSKAPPLTVNGRSIDKLSTSSLRRMIAVVPQSSPIFSASVRRNITYGLANAAAYNKIENVMAAARLAGIHGLIQSMPQGYETMIGHGGRGLSGGQSQRIAIARALIRQPKLLILDEATSALDPESAKLIRQTVNELKNDTRMRMTILIITHSRDMMELADHVVILDRGVLMEQGGFAELLQSQGHLTNLLNSGIIET